MLAEIGSQTQRFLRMIAEDVAISTLQTGWLATDFANGSVDFNIESTGDADEQQIRHYAGAVRRVTAFRPSGPLPAGLRTDTVLQFARLAELIEPGDSARLGLFDNGTSSPAVWRVLSKSDGVAIREHIENRVEYWGMIQGIIHSLFKEAEPPYFYVREISSDSLVRCTFPADRYSQFIPLLQNRRTVVFVSGYVTARRADRKIERVRIERMEPAPQLSDAEFEKFFGSAPNFTADLSTEEFLDEIRREHE
jgi:hypothetical protein